MRTNTIKQSLTSRTPTTGAWLTLGSPAVAEVMAHSGFDWLVIDLEHAPNDPASATEQLRALGAAREAGARAEALIRIAELNPVLVKRAMDIGCQSIIVPNVNTAVHAELAVRAMRFPDGGNDGIRGVAGLVRGGRFGLDPEYVNGANAQACTIVQIESAEALGNVEEIAAVEGVDCLFIGTADLSASMGRLGQPTHPAVREAIARIIAAAHAENKSVGAFAVSVEDARWYRDVGAEFIALHSDVAWLARGSMGALTDLNA
ncbi:MULTISPECIES: HpcH/HpaI aldolase/citrate lyase family protein [unclassified Cryobacterium]|uniref:HpcH/HpaI aldolase family protein n=1 Tax=unclassified Cryobacterium TaxID=2649013 RepID=UPI000CE53825|nr:MULTISPECIES: aldolase/citrate lyase family protein [unclassified Cryobacterium]